MAGKSDALPRPSAGGPRSPQQGDTVVVLGHTNLAKGERSERLPVVHIWRYRGDEEICRLQTITDTLESARILGMV